MRPTSAARPSGQSRTAASKVRAMCAVISAGDVILDALLLRLHTACRCGGALALRLVDLDTRSCLVRLAEKGGTLRWQVAPGARDEVDVLQFAGVRARRGLGSRPGFVTRCAGLSAAVRWPSATTLR